jgi:hypothetical protein
MSDQLRRLESRVARQEARLHKLQAAHPKPTPEQLSPAMNVQRNLSRSTRELQEDADKVAPSRLHFIQRARFMDKAHDLHERVRMTGVSVVALRDDKTPLQVLEERGEAPDPHSDVALAATAAMGIIIATR